MRIDVFTCQSILVFVDTLCPFPSIYNRAAYFHRLTFTSIVLFIILRPRVPLMLVNPLTHPDATGICAVAGSGFGQAPGTYHIRVTALCPGVEEYVGKIEKFHAEFMEKWS